MNGREEIGARLRRVRERTVALAAPLSYDEQLAQPFPDASPTKWHLGHTSWFFDRFVLAAFAPRHAVDPDLEYVFNSYYEAIGARQPRHQRALAVRPTLTEVHAYRQRVDAAMNRFVAEVDEATWAKASFAVLLGTHHEEQHQELLLTDIKPTLAGSRIAVGYPKKARPERKSSALTWTKHEGGLRELGMPTAELRFGFDNEKPQHRVWVEPFELASRPVTNREYAAFVEDGGYRTSTLWLSDGWATVQEQSWSAPLYWQEREGSFFEHELGGLAPLDLEAPVSHLSLYEADAYARWAEARLPTEAEWELSAAQKPVEGNLLESGLLHPRAAEHQSGTQHYGDVWEWTASSYAPYPRYQPFSGAFGEYNGKFMSGQMVLRGGSAFTPRDHIRPTYRNFFPPSARWQLTGLRLARWS